MVNNRRNRIPSCGIFPGYNWCGPGCSGPGAPVNRVDAACKAHDECYRIYGSICKCDIQFMRRLQAYRTPQTLEGRQANVMYKAMKIKSRFSCGY
ncbi:phospholipase [Virgibacillus sp. DJP39]|uniref:phospholipase n=1 Tax=Virgibacillus sp. DJP39 TaxID=3409790 RepID=UPI003BB650A7